MIGFMIQYVRSAAAISIGLALIFAVSHFLLYRYSNPMHLALSMAALSTLLLSGVTFNNLYLAFRHIGFSWALHAGWNVIWLPAVVYDAAADERLYEPQMFDRVLGSQTVFIAACGAAVLSVLLLARKRSYGVA